MPPNEPKPVSVQSSQARFVILVIGAIVISILLTLVSLALYKSSGASQLDLSRPGYSNSYRQRAATSNDVEAFPSSGDIDESTIDSFDKSYDAALKQITSIDKENGVEAFGGNPLSDKSLQIEP